MSYAKKQARILAGVDSGVEYQRLRNRQQESADQQAVMAWVRGATGRYPCLALMHAIPNGGQRHVATGARLKREGARAGVPDLHLPVAACGYSSLYVEMKAEGGKLSREQREVIALLQRYGNRVEVCIGSQNAIEAITAYVRGVKE